MKKFCFFFFSLFKKYEKRKVLHLFLVTSLPQGPQTSREGISPGIKCKVWRKGMRNYKVMSLWRRKNLWYIKKNRYEKVQNHKVANIDWIGCKKLSGVFFSSYLVEHFLGNGKKEITFVKKEKHEEVGKDDHHARKWMVGCLFSRHEASKALVYMI